MVPVARVLGASGLALGAWCALGAVAVLHGGTGRAAFLPAWWVLAALIATALVLASSSRLRSARWLPLGILPLFLLPFLPGQIPPAFLLWTGRMIWGVTVMALAAVLFAARVAWPRTVVDLLRDPRRAPVAASVVAFAIFLAGARNLQGMVPGGDEPHYLVITQSLLYDRDLRIENNHQRRDYLPYFDGTLRPDYLRRGADGQIYSVHAPGISAIVLPAFALAGYGGVVAFLSLICAAATGFAWWVAWRLTEEAGAAWLAWAAGALSAPFTIQAFSIYPDALASVIALSAVTALVLPVEQRPTRWVLHGAALAILPWLHTRHSALAAVLGASIVWRLAVGRRSVADLAGFLLVPALSAAAWFAHFWTIYGTVSPSAPYGGLRHTSSLSFLRVTLPGLFFDQQFGLVTNAPLIGIALAGVGVLVWRGRGRRLAGGVDDRTLGLTLLLLVGTYAAASGTYRMWWAGSSSPARFLVPVMLPLTLPVAAFWTHCRSRASRALALAALVSTVLITTVFLGAQRGRLAFNWRDGYSQLADWLSPAADLPNALPSLIRDPLPLALQRIAFWAGVVLASWLLLRGVEWWTRTSRAAFALLALWVGAVGAMSAASLSWRASDAPATRPSPSQLALIRRYSPPWRVVSVRYGQGIALATPGDVLESLRIDAVSRGPLRPGELLVLPDVPAGRYGLAVEAGGQTAGRVSLGIGRGADVRSWPLAGGGDPEAMVVGEFLLPADVRGLVIRADPHAHDVVSRAWLIPRSLGLPDRVPGQAIVAARYGTLIVYALDAESWVEPGGIWTRPARTAGFVLQADTARSTHRVLVGGGAVDNVCALETGAWQLRLDLPAGATRSVDVPASASGGPTRLEVQAARGFRPAELEPGSTDLRGLGCRLEFH